MKTKSYVLATSFLLCLFTSIETNAQNEQKTWKHFVIYADINQDTIFKYLFDELNIYDCVKSKIKYQLVVNMFKDEAIIVGKYDSKNVETDKEACRFDNSFIPMKGYGHNFEVVFTK